MQILQLSMNVRQNNDLLFLLREGLEGDEKIVFDIVKWSEVVSIVSAHRLSVIAYDGGATRH